MLRRVIPGTLLLVLLAGARPASAQLAPFVQGDLTNRTWVGAELGLGMIDADDTTIMHLSGLIEWSLNEKTEIYGRLPLTRVDTDFLDGSGLGNITAGGRMFWPSAGGNTMWSAHAAVSLPTASDGGESGFATSLTSFYELPHDVGWWVPNASTIRFGGNYGYRQATWFIQAELGLHFLLVDDADDSLLIKYGFAGGVNVGTALAVIGELSGYSDVLDDEAFGNEDTLSSLDVGLRWKGQSIAIGGRLYLPLDDVFRDNDVAGVIFDLRADL